MLNELYHYALNQGLAARPGFESCRVKAYVSLSGDGNLVAVDPEPPEPVTRPSIGSLANSANKCQVPVEKAQIILTEEKPAKRRFFLNTLAQAAQADQASGVVLRALQNAEAREQIWQALTVANIKPGDIIGFKVDGRPLEQSGSFLAWWEGFHRQLLDSGGKGGRRRCLISGELCEPQRTTDKISGLMQVGGHSSGDKLIGFDKDAFCSYGLEQAANAPVSDAAMAAVNAALENLLAGSPIVAGAKWLHWYKEPVSAEADPLLFLSGDYEREDPEEEDDGSAGNQWLLSGPARAAARQAVESGRRGERPQQLTNRYYLLSLSGANGRIMVRSWQEGGYEDLRHNMASWYDGLRLIRPDGLGFCKPPKLYALNLVLLRPVKNARKTPHERMAEELSALEQRIISAMLHNGPLPEQVAEKALRHIRSQMLGSGDSRSGGNNEVTPDPLACQWLKLWLLRKQSCEGGVCAVKDGLDREPPSAAFQAGRMMAVFAAAQADALGPNPGAGVIQRYYAAASASPALVIGRLSVLSQYHLAKLKSKGRVRYYSDLLGEISAAIGHRLPAVLTLTEQGEFALGYYQQRAAIKAETASKQPGTAVDHDVEADDKIEEAE